MNLAVWRDLEINDCKFNETLEGYQDLTTVSCIKVNVSPLLEGHSLFVPRIGMLIPQAEVTLDSIN